MKVLVDGIQWNCSSAASTPLTHECSSPFSNSAWFLLNHSITNQRCQFWLIGVSFYFCHFLFFLFYIFSVGGFLQHGMLRLLCWEWMWSLGWGMNCGGRWVFSRSLVDVKIVSVPMFGRRFSEKGIWSCRSWKCWRKRMYWEWRE